jgi:predicted metal-dependent peptidase
MTHFNPPRIVNATPQDAEAANRLSLAMTRVVIDHPFFATVLLRMHKVETTDIPTMGVDGIHLFYNPQFVHGKKTSELVFVLLHEIEHIVFMHHLRQNERDAELWNIAGDIVINGILSKDCGLTAPKDAIIVKKYDGWHTEAVYNDLYKDMQKQKQQHGPGAAGCGMVFPQQAPGGNEMSESDREYAEGELKQVLSQAATVAKRQGKLPAHLERLIQDLLEAKINWREYLHNFVKGKIKSDYTWTKPNRRYVGGDLYLPSVYSESPGEIVVVVDTSGSIGEHELKQFGGEIKAIVGDVKPEKTHVIYCDSQVNKVEVFTQDDEIVMLKGVGGGGTSFRPPFEYVKKKHIEPMALIYLTDMYGDFPGSPPSYPVLWGSTTKNLQAPFGQTLYIDFDQK